MFILLVRVKGYHFNKVLTIVKIKINLKPFT